MTDQQKLETWGILELFGHLRLAGMISEATICGCSFTQGAIYGLTLTTEEVARGLAEMMRAQPIQPYDLPRERLIAGDLDNEICF